MDEFENTVTYLVVIIYDIMDDKQRLKISKYLSSYGERVQKSSFEARLTKKQYIKMIQGLEHLLRADDDVRIYKVRGYEEVKIYGSKKYIEDEDVIII